MTFVGDRGMIKGPQIQLLKEHEDNFHYISALTKPQIEGLLKKGILQMSLFDEAMAEVLSEEGGERFVVRRNPIRAEEMKRNRQDRLDSLNNRAEKYNAYLEEHPKAKVEVRLRRMKDNATRLKIRKWVEIEPRGTKLSLQVNPEELAAVEKLLAEAPNQVWSWDITKLRGPVKWTYYYLYVILDIFSRYVVGWMLAHRESAALAQRLIAESCRKQDIEPDQLTLHADRGSSMRSKPVGLLLADLGVTKTHSRPYVSNDNPYSESQFKTMKYCPQFPSRFGSAEDGRLFCCGFFAYYNFHHRHSGIGLMTPADVHYGRAEQLTTARRQILLEAQQAHPERFVRGTPQPPVLPPQAWINPPLEKTTLHEAALSLVHLNSAKIGVPGVWAKPREGLLRRFSHSFCGLVARFIPFPGFLPPWPLWPCSASIAPVRNCRR